MCNFYLKNKFELVVLLMPYSKKGRKIITKFASENLNPQNFFHRIITWFQATKCLCSNLQLCFYWFISKLFLKKCLYCFLSQKSCIIYLGTYEYGFQKFYGSKVVWLKLALVAKSERFCKLLNNDSISCNFFSQETNIVLTKQRVIWKCVNKLESKLQAGWQKFFSQ